MESDDLSGILAWRNADEVRRNMLSDKLITIVEHQEWFDRCRLDDRCEWLIAEYSGTAVGVIGITDIDRISSSCTWSMYLSNPSKVPGVGALMEFQAIERMFRHHNIRKIWGETLRSNHPTLALHRKFGFTQEGVYLRQIRRGNGFEDVIRLALFDIDWKDTRTRLLGMLSLQKSSRSIPKMQD